MAQFKSGQIIEGPYIEVTEASPFDYWVSYRKYRLGKLWRHDTTMNLSQEDAIACAQRRQAITGYPIVRSL